MSDCTAEQRAIAAEQAYVDVVYDRLEESAKVASSLVKEGYARGQVGNEGGLVERDAMVYQAQRRLSALNSAHEGLVFGRLDLNDGQARYIGRIGVRDADREILLIDWRAPAASQFYQSTAQEPDDVVRRRVLRSSGQRVIGVEDELLDADAAPDSMEVVGEGALLASLSRARDNTMHSVVATIQKEQDEIIRAPIRGATIIGGGPGTGKTVVALHRAAYLLYSDRRRFERGGVLVIGPSSIFMSYIDRVLPSLGETAVTLRSLGAVVDGIAAIEHDVPEAAAAKGSERMVAILRRLASSAQPGEPSSFRYFYKDDVLSLDAEQLARIRRGLLRGLKRNRAYTRAPAMVAQALWSQVHGERALEKGEEEFLSTLTEDPRFVDFIESWWPTVDATELWRTLPGRIVELAGGAFDPSEISALQASWADGQIRIEDVPLIDELRYLVGEVPVDAESDDDLPRQLMSFERREREVDSELRSTTSIDDDGYAHVLVDEAQDLSPMQWRMVGRRGRQASWTIVGDQAQSSWPYRKEAATARSEALKGKAEHAFRLSTNYRNSAEVYDLAAQVAGLAIEGADLPEAVRRTGQEPDHRWVSEADLATTVLDSTSELLDRVAGTVAVVTSRGQLPSVREDLSDLLDLYRQRLRVLDGLDTKGLEFDAVLVVEPDEIIAESPTGWRTLYVVLTRATQLLVTVGTSQTWRTRIG